MPDTLLKHSASLEEREGGEGRGRGWMKSLIYLEKEDLYIQNSFFIRKKTNGSHSEAAFSVVESVLWVPMQWVLANPSQKWREAICPGRFGWGYSSFVRLVFCF
jgi:hypothetical protein